MKAIITCLFLVCVFGFKTAFGVLSFNKKLGTDILKDQTASLDFVVDDGKLGNYDVDEEQAVNSDYEDPDMTSHKWLFEELKELIEPKPKKKEDELSSLDRYHLALSEFQEIETIQRKWLIGETHREFTVPNKKHDTWQLLDDAKWSNKSIALVVSGSNSSHGTMLSSKPLPESFFDDAESARRDWRINLEFNVVTDSGPSDVANVEHDAAIIIASKETFELIQQNDLQIEHLPEFLPAGKAFVIPIKVRQNPAAPNETLISVEAVRRHRFRIAILTLALQHETRSSCVTSYHPLKLGGKAVSMVTSEISISGSHLSDVVHIELPHSKCILEVDPDLMLTDHRNIHLAITAWSRFSLDRFVVTGLFVASSENAKSDERFASPLVNDTFDDDIFDATDMVSLERSSEQAEQEINRMLGAMSNNEETTPAPPAFTLTDVDDKDEYYHRVLENFHLSLPLDQEKWFLHGSATSDNGKIHLNTKAKGDGMIISVKSAPSGKESWRLDSVFHIIHRALNASEADQQWGSFALKLVGKRAAQMILEGESDDDVIRSALTGSGDFSKEPFLSVWFGIIFNDFGRNIGTLDCRTTTSIRTGGGGGTHPMCYSAIGASRENEIFNETVTISLIKEGASTVTVKLEWWKGVEGFTSVNRQPVCAATTTFKGRDWPFGSNDSLHIIATAPSNLNAAPGSKPPTIVEVDLVSLSLSPIIAVEAFESPAAPVLANNKMATHVSVPLCHEASLSDCLLDCSIKLALPHPITIWLKKEVDTPGKLQQIDGTEGLAVLQLAKIPNVQVGDKIICIAKNNYGQMMRTFTITDAESWRAGAVLQRWHGALLYFGGLLTAVLAALVSFGIVFLRSRLATRPPGQGDTYSLLQRNDEHQ